MDTASGDPAQHSSDAMWVMLVHMVSIALSSLGIRRHHSSAGARQDASPPGGRRTGPGRANKEDAPRPLRVPNRSLKSYRDLKNSLIVDIPNILMLQNTAKPSSAY